MNPCMIFDIKPLHLPRCRDFTGHSYDTSKSGRKNRMFHTSFTQVSHCVTSLSGAGIQTARCARCSSLWNTPSFVSTLYRLCLLTLQKYKFSFLSRGLLVRNCDMAVVLKLSHDPQRVWVCMTSGKRKCEAELMLDSSAPCWNNKQTAFTPERLPRFRSERFPSAKRHV